jgi:hypothetical protein
MRTEFDIYILIIIKMLLFLIWIISIWRFRRIKEKKYANSANYIFLRKKKKMKKTNILSKKKPTIGVMTVGESGMRQSSTTV